MNTSLLASEKRGLVQVVSLALFVCVLLAMDGILYHIFDIIRRHTFAEYSLISSHDVHIDIGGKSMLANLLRKTVGAFNTSSSLDMQSSNQQCLPEPQALSQADYLWSVIPLLVMGLMCCLQVYTNRLRRVISAFYFPKVMQHPRTAMEVIKKELSCDYCVNLAVIKALHMHEKKHLQCNAYIVKTICYHFKTTSLILCKPPHVIISAWQENRSGRSQQVWEL
uniref:Dendritic cell-specific transmembrane protein-like domain-containing protein n=1 Tax=Electrophorus electricus TaxID=8005 RepID=A0A4W4G7A7_ELEEL